MATSTGATSYSFLGALPDGKIEKFKRESDVEDGERVEAVEEGDLEEEDAGGRYLTNVSLIAVQTKK